MAQSPATQGTFSAKIRSEDRTRLEEIKRHPRETYGDIVHRLVVEELTRRGDDDHASGGAAEEAA
jgi:hypothetical protein